MPTSIARVRHAGLELLNRLRVFPELSSPRLDKFLQAVQRDSLSRVCGLTSLALLLISFFWPQGTMKWALAVTALPFLLVATYRIWADADTELEALKENVRLPALRGEILELKFTPCTDTDAPESGVLGTSKHDVFVRLQVANQGAATTIKAFLLTLDLGKGRLLRSHEMFRCSGGRATLSTFDGEGLQPCHIPDLGEKLSCNPLQQGTFEEGWLWFVFTGADFDELRRAAARIVLTDALGNPWPLVGRPPWSDSGQITICTRETLSR